MKSTKTDVNNRKLIQYDSYSQKIADQLNVVSAETIGMILTQYYKLIEDDLKSGDKVVTPIGSVSLRKRDVSKTVAPTAKPTIVADLSLDTTIKSVMRSIIDENSPNYNEGITTKLTY